MQLHNFVGGVYIESSASTFTDVLDPSRGQSYARAPVSVPDDLDRAFAAAVKGFEAWRDLTPAARQRALLRIADTLEARAEELVEAEVRNTGKPRVQVARGELPHILDCLRFFAGAARRLDEIAAAEYVAGHTSLLRREPLGVVAAVTPWNYPLMMAIWKVAPALAAGNAVVLKPAETTPVTPLMLAELAAEHLPAGTLNVVCGDRDTGRALVAHPVPAMVAITGSVRAGREVAAAAGQALELGGKAPASPAPPPPG